MQRFKQIIIVFWALWWLIALWTDLVGILSHLKLINATWALDTNYPFLIESLKIYSPATWLHPVLFACIMLWSCFNTILFIYACAALKQPRTIWLSRANSAFTISLSFWFAFFLADQLVMKFDLEENHMIQGGFQLLTFLCLHLLPEK